MYHYKAQLQTVLFDLKHKPHCLLEKKALELETMIEAYIAGDITLPEDDTAEPTILPEVEPEIEDGVAVIEISGIICKRLGLPEEILDLFGLVDLDNVDAQIKSAMNDANVTAVVLYVSSPGGFLSGVQSTANLVDKLSQVKETVVYSDVVNASAAYWISSQANTIIVSSDAELGSIGVYTTITDYSKMLDSAGVKVTLIKAGKYKAIGDPTQSLTDEQKAFVQTEIDSTWSLFKSTVNIKRTIAEDDMQGQTFSGKALLDKGFVDGFAIDIEEVIGALTTEATNN